MNLEDFISGPYRNEWIEEPGLSYYVRKSLLLPGVIELATCYAIDDGSKFGFYRFLKRYASDIPFTMEQVLNPAMAQYMRKLGWLEIRIGGVPQFASPLTAREYADNVWFEKRWKIYVDC